jgi:hypothetical protein
MTGFAIVMQLAHNRKRPSSNQQSMTATRTGMVAIGPISTDRSFSWSSSLDLQYYLFPYLLLPIHFDNRKGCTTKKIEPEQGLAH